MLLLESKAFIRPKWARGQGTKDALLFGIFGEDASSAARCSRGFHELQLLSESHVAPSLHSAAGERSFKHQCALATNSASNTVIARLTYQANLSD